MIFVDKFESVGRLVDFLTESVSRFFIGRGQWVTFQQMFLSKVGFALFISIGGS